MIVKDIYKDLDGETAHMVKGLNTAASVWLSAAVGVACGGGLYFVATYTSFLMLVLLRFGPRHLVERRGSDQREESATSITMLLPTRISPPRESARRKAEKQEKYQFT